MKPENKRGGSEMGEPVMSLRGKDFSDQGVRTALPSVSARPAFQEFIAKWRAELKRIGEINTAENRARQFPELSVFILLNELEDLLSAPPVSARPQEETSEVCKRDVSDLQGSIGDRHRTIRGDGVLLPNVSEERETVADSAGKGRLQTSLDPPGAPVSAQAPATPTDDEDRKE